MSVEPTTLIDPRMKCPWETLGTKLAPFQLHMINLQDIIFQRN